MATLHIHAQNSQTAKVEAQEGELLSDILHRAGRLIMLPCGGNHTCGKCLVWVQGSFAPPAKGEMELLHRAKGTIPPGEGAQLRLACCCRITGSGNVYLPETGDGAAILAGSAEAAAQYDGADANALGVAVDIGTTTLALELHHLAQGKKLATVCEMNQQGAYGADVLSRIAYAEQGNLQQLQAIIHQQLNNMLDMAVSQAQVQARNVQRVVVTGNTTMLHLLRGLNPAGIGRAPFVPQSLFGEACRADEIFPALQPGAELYIPRCVGAYVGADITCGMLCAGMGAAQETVLLVDVGTNGEMALYNEGKILCCATAAGPAFEGAEISMGMAAKPGAVNHVFVQQGQVCFTTISGAAPCGLCGTGLISALSMMVQQGIVDETGEIQAEGHGFTSLVEQVNGQPAFCIGASGVLLTQQDIRQLQLAKAAIAAGIETLLHEAGVPAAKVNTLFLAGGFGNSFNPADAAGMGLLPAGLLQQARGLGNAALNGAVHLLYARHLYSQTEKMAAEAEEIALSSSPYFMDRYIENMMFEAL